MRFRFIDLLLYVLLFVFVNAFPVDLLPIDYIGQIIIQISLRALLIAYYIYVLYKNRINIFRFANYKRTLLFLPFLLICFSNLIAAGIGGSKFVLSYHPVYLPLIIVYHLFGVVVEEFLFRLFIQNSLVFASSLKRIFASAAIFALFHLINMVNVSTVDSLINVLIQVVYSFGLGLLLAMVYEYSYSIPACIIFHFLFNFFNLVFVGNIYAISTAENVFLITAVVIGVIVGVYALLIYLFILRRNDRYFRE